MKIKLEQDLNCREIEVLIRYDRMEQTVRKLERLVRSFEKTVKCTSDGVETWVNASDIYYVESVDKKTFVYCERDVYRIDLRLFQIEEELSAIGFVKVSKSCALNVNVLKSIRPLLNSRMEAELINGEKIHITRKYVSSIKEKLLEDIVL